MSNRLRRVGLLSALALVAAVPAAVPAMAAAKTTITMSGSTSVAPLAALLARKYLNVCDHCVSFKLLQGGSDIGVTDVAAGRVTIGNSSRDPKPTDPGGLVFNKIAHDALCIVTNKANPLPGLDQAQSPGDLRRQRAQLERRARARRRPARSTCSSAPPPRAPRTPSRRSSWAARSLSAAPARRPPTAWSSRRSQSTPNGDRLRLARFTKSVHDVPYKGVPAPCATRSPASTAACATSSWSPRGAPTGAAEEVDQLGHAQQRGQQIIATALGAAAASEQPTARSDAKPTAPHRPARRAGPRRAGLRGPAADRRHGRLRLPEGVAVVRPQRPRLVRRRRQRRRAARRTSSTRRPNPADYVYTLHAWPLLYGDVRCHRRRGPARRSSSRCSRRSSSSSSRRERCRRVLEPVVRLLAAVPSVVYGLIGILVLVPFVGNHLISQGAEGVGRYVVQLDGASLLRRRPGADRDDHADHDRDHRRRAALGAARLDRGRGGARRQPLAGDVDDLGCAPRARRSSPPRCSPPRARWARRSCSRWSRARSASRRTRSTASPSSSSRRGRWPRRSSTTPRASRSCRSGRRSTPSPRSCSSPASSSRFAGWVARQSMRKYRLQAGERG